MSSAPSSTSTPSNTTGKTNRFRYGTDMVRGVNLGGWSVFILHAVGSRLNFSLGLFSRYLSYLRSTMSSNPVLIVKVALDYAEPF